MTRNLKGRPRSKAGRRGRIPAGPAGSSSRGGVGVRAAAAASRAARRRRDRARRPRRPPAKARGRVRVLDWKTCNSRGPGCGCGPAVGPTRGPRRLSDEGVSERSCGDAGGSDANGPPQPQPQPPRAAAALFMAIKLAAAAGSGKEAASTEPTRTLSGRRVLPRLFGPFPAGGPRRRCCLFRVDAGDSAKNPWTCAKKKGPGTRRTRRARIPRACGI